MMLELVKNIVGSSDNSLPSGCDSWLEYWEQQTGRKARACSSCRSITGLCGGHVRKVNNSSKQYIVPICAQHNNYHTTESYTVNAVDLVEI